jgi:branched-chain amino acid transport system substrate-binding protein
LTDQRRAEIAGMTWSELNLDGALHKWYLSGNVADSLNVYGYLLAQTVVEVLKRCRDELTRENVMRQATSLNNFELPMLLPGIKINTSPSDYFPIKQMRMATFVGRVGC